MRLVVATNFDDTLLQGLADAPVEVVYGKLRSDAVGGGRPSHILPEVTREQIAHHVKQAHEYGMEFNYLVNASSLEGREHDRQFQLQLEQLLGWVDDIGADGVVVAMPFMVQFVRRYFPRLKISISSLADIRTPRMAQRYEEMGVDTIILGEAANRDFAVLENLRSAVHCDLELVLNNSCVYDCPYKQSHGNLSARTSRPGTDVRYEYMMFYCAACMVADLTDLIRSRWIRPEDLWAYEELGIDRFKIAGRNKSTDWILRAAQAYARRSYVGNLTDIISMSQAYAPIVSRQLRSTTVWDDEADLSEVEELDMALQPLKGVIVDNTRIPSRFIEFFRNNDCTRLSCKSCRYCEAVAQQAVAWTEGKPPTFVAPGDWPPAHLLPWLVDDEKTGSM